MSDLASFFAQKDKKKKNKKAQTFTPEDLLKKIEADPQAAQDNGYDSNGDVQAPKVVAAAPSYVKADDEEWEDPEANREIDLSKLKIQNLGEKEKERQEVEEKEERQKAVEESKTTMKWNIGRREDSDESSDEEVEEEKPEETKPEAKVETAPVDSTPATSVYVPPGRRGIVDTPPVRQNTLASGVVLEKLSIKRGGSHQSRNIDVSSNEQFPSLGMANQIHSQASAWGASMNRADGAGSYTEVRKGARGAQEGQGSESLSTSNKFSALKGNRT